MRRYLWLFHSWLGLLAGIGLLLIGLSGSLLVFRDEINRSLCASVYAVPNAELSRLSFDVLRKHIERQLPDAELTGWHPAMDRSGLADELYLLPHHTREWKRATLDPHTGKLLSAPHAYADDPMGWLLEFHKSFLGGKTGVAVAGLLGAILVLLGLSGLWLHRQFWRQVPRLRLRQGSRLLVSDLHKLVGASSAVLLLILGFTGAYWSLTEVFEKNYEQPELNHRLYAASLSVDTLIKQAATRLPGFRTQFITFPSTPEGGSIMLWGAVAPLPFWRDPYGSTLSFDPRSGELLKISDIRDASAWEQTVSAFRPLHFGSFGGLPIKLVYCAAGLAPGLLALSGLIIARLRRRAQVSIRKACTESAATSADESSA
jgi:uncharacterized iron-regulated membrane protein